MCPRSSRARSRLSSSTALAEKAGELVVADSKGEEADGGADGGHSVVHDVVHVDGMVID